MRTRRSARLLILNASHEVWVRLSVSDALP